MKKPEAVMEILEAYDLTGSFRAATGLVGCDHKTVAYWARQRDEAGGMPVVERSRPAMEKVFLAKIEELVDRSHGQIRRRRQIRISWNLIIIRGAGWYRSVIDCRRRKDAVQRRREGSRLSPARPGNPDPEQ
jgi:hypothetical protein